MRQRAHPTQEQVEPRPPTPPKPPPPAGGSGVSKPKPRPYVRLTVPGGTYEESRARALRDAQQYFGEDASISLRQDGARDRLRNQASSVMSFETDWIATLQDET